MFDGGWVMVSGDGSRWAGGRWMSSINPDEGMRCVHVKERERKTETEWGRERKRKRERRRCRRVSWNSRDLRKEQHNGRVRIIMTYLDDGTSSARNWRCTHGKWADLWTLWIVWHSRKTKLYAAIPNHHIIRTYYEIIFVTRLQGCMNGCGMIALCVWHITIW